MMASYYPPEIMLLQGCPFHESLDRSLTKAKAQIHRDTDGK